MFNLVIFSAGEMQNSNILEDFLNAKAKHVL